MRDARFARQLLAGAGALLLSGAAVRAWAAPPATAPAGASMQITKENYHGWPNTYRLRNGLIEAHVVTDVGPRVIDLRVPGGANLFHIREGLGGRGEATYMFRGGWRLWVAPERTETTYALDNAACKVETVGASMLRVTAPPQPAAGIQKTIEVSLSSGEPRLHMVSHIKNISDHALTYAAWSLPVMQPGGRAFVPLDVGPLSAFDATRRLLLWSYAKFADPRYRFGDRLIQIDSARVPAPPAGQTGRRDDESKIGVDSGQGWAGYLLGSTLFLKRFPHPVGEYPDGGATIEVYSNHDFLELEHLGSLTTIKPGEEIVFPEDWWLFTGASVPTAEAEAVATLQQYVARAPFP
jgi:hypothetical protein